VPAAGSLCEARQRRPTLRSRAYGAPAGQSRGRAEVGDGIDWRAGYAAESRGRQLRLRFAASQPRALPGAASAFDVDDAGRGVPSQVQAADGERV